MNRSDQINELVSALAKAQAMMRSAAKDSVNPHFKSRYSDLASVMDALREPLSSNGLALLQPASTLNGDVVVTTVLAHSSGQWMSDALTLTPQQKTPQATGSAITYGRRYGAMAITGLSSDDDDGEEASRPPIRRVDLPRRDDGPRYEPTDSPPEIERYHASPAQKKRLTALAAPFGVTTRNELQTLSDACLANGGVEMEHLAAAVKEWVDGRGRSS